MEDKLITEHAGTSRDEISRYYQYGGGGVRVLDTQKTVKRLYLFDPSSGIMTERDPRRAEKILRRFVFDKYGMLEETFAFGERPRTFRYEDGGRQIAVREGGEYGAVGKIITFEKNGIAETAWGRNGEIEHVYQVDTKGDAITVRAGGWFGEIERTIVFAGMGASLFLEPEAFLQFLMFTEWSAKDREEDINERVAEIRGGKDATPGRSPYAYTAAPAAQKKAAQRILGLQKNGQNARLSPDERDIDFIRDADAPAVEDSRKQRILSRQSRDISYQERRDHEDGGGLSRGRSAEIPLQERFERPDREPETFSRGKSAEIPLDERFENAQKERGKLPRGRSAEIPYDERRGGENR
ncbi:MAG: hypothetical protein EHM53_02360 [Methanoregulaceae archaeon]|nr:MAG: hypothetical protein EHM53_02360 [Methanoregulaceae archaeon]